MYSLLSNASYVTFRLDRIMKTEEFAKLRKTLPAVKQIEEKNRKMRSGINKQKVQVANAKIVKEIFTPVCVFAN